ncbi:recombinase family protein [Aquimarina litoralis]|uniref:Recombinase family protein n=1 Tax=Aquimarina litoralis TaxID=584605 RepID=A0ABN1J1A9_9FLAO
MIFGYARVSTEEQSLDLQLDALLKDGVSEKNIYTDKVSGIKSERKNLSKLLKHLREGDTLVVWKLDRLVRSLIHLTNLMNDFEHRGIKFRSITEPFIDTTQDSPHNMFITNIFGALAQLERDIIIERTKAGLESARRRGKILGAPKGISEKNKQRAELCAYYFREGKLSVSEICERVGVSRATYYKYLDFKGLSNKKRKYQSNKIK